MPIQSAQAATGLEPLDTASFQLTRIGADNTDLIKSVEATLGADKVAPVTEVLGGRTGRANLCHGTGVNWALKVDGFCWDEDDDKSGYTDEPLGGWMPQGFAGAHAATPDGLYAGRHLYATSWYFGKFRNGDPGEDYTRISIAESTGDRVTYGHIALVEPTSGGFKQLRYKSHADGVAWYGDRLFVANGVELQVYDLTHIWRMDDTTRGDTGLIDGKTSARFHRWALPLVARYSTYTKAGKDPTEPFPGANPRSCGPANDELCLSTVSVDRSDSPSLVSAENRKGAGGRIVHWPLADLGVGAPTVVPALQKGYTSPVYNMQGIATDGTDYYMSGDCPETWPGYKTYSCIHVAGPGDAPHVKTQAPWLTQGLSWDPHAKRLWGANEALKDTNGNGRRVVFSLDPHAGRTVDGWGWLANHNRPGSVCATPQSDDTADGTPVTVWTCTGAESQRWAFRDGRIVHKMSGKCLTPKGDASDVDGTVLTLWTCNPASNSQKFSPGVGAIVNSSGKAITPKGNEFINGAWLTLWTASPDPSRPEKPDQHDVVQEWAVTGF